MASMSFCPQCGTQIPDGSSFCPACGYNVAAAQPAQPAQGYPQQQQTPLPQNPQQGPQPQTNPPQAYPQQSSPQQVNTQPGYPQATLPQQGYPQQGYPQQGYPQQGGQPGYPTEWYQYQQQYAPTWYPQGWQQPRDNRNQIEQLLDKVNEMTGGTEPVKLHMSYLVDSITRSHTREEAEDIFICGTARTTPPENAISVAWPHPWLYSRILGIFLIATVALLFMAIQFQNPNVLPGLMFIGSTMVPFAVLFFFFEVNAPRNISFYEVLLIFLVGGIASLVVSLGIGPIFDRILSDGKDGWTLFEAMGIGLYEEIGKAVPVAYFLREVKKKYILNGLLIGAAVGAGFAAFESAGYAFKPIMILLSQSAGQISWNDIVNASMSNITLRAILAPGGHVIWAAITGAALAMVKGARDMAPDMLTHPSFLKFFAIPILMHGTWDYFALNTNPSSVIYGTCIATTVISWAVALVLLNAGLRQISQMTGQQRPD